MSSDLIGKELSSALCARRGVVTSGEEGANMDMDALYPLATAGVGLVPRATDVLAATSRANFPPPSISACLYCEEGLMGLEHAPTPTPIPNLGS